MKTLHIKRIVVIVCIALFSSHMNAVTHGSMKGEGLTLYEQGVAGGNTAGVVRTTILDYKIVTIGTNTWAWIKTDGSFIDTGADWTSQLRYWSDANAKTEIPMINRNATNNLATETWIKTSATMPSPLHISFFNSLISEGFSETELIPYDPTLINSLDAGDNTPPVINSCTTSSVEETSATLSIDGSDNASDVFYYISGNGIEEVAFRSSFNLTGLIANTAYNLTVTPIDFSGNEGTPSNISFTTAGLVQITSGIAQDIKFVFKSTNNELEYYYEFTNPNNKFRDAFLKITPSGDVEFELKPTISPDSTYAYGKTTDARIANKILALNCGYWIAPGLPDYSDYVVSNTLITSGTLTGTAIKHQMGGGISPDELEATAPVLNAVTLLDVTDKYIKLNLNGSDNSGTVYYEITGAKQTVNGFRTGDYYLTEIEAGKTYTLNIVAKDLSGNYSDAQQVVVKTINARSNIVTNVGLNYNSNTTVASGGELVSIIEQTGNTLTLGCTTASNVIENLGWRDRVFNTPTVNINGTSYPLTLDANGTTASITFTDDVNGVAIQAGSSFSIQWSVFWGVTGGGNFFTGTFTYTIGDNGQIDTEAPSVPVLTLNGNNLSWPACSDLLSGVKYYEVTETGQEPVIIFDLGEPNFTYTLTNATNEVVVKAVDFVGNISSETINDSGSGIENIEDANVIVFPNPTSEKIFISGAKVAEISLYSVQGQLIKSTFNVNSIDVSTLSKGLYILKIKDTQANTKTTKVAIH